MIVVKIVEADTSERVLEDLHRIYELLREGDLVFVCDRLTFVCLLADTNDDSAAAVEARLTVALGRRRVLVERISPKAGTAASLAGVVSTSVNAAGNQLR